MKAIPIFYYHSISGQGPETLALEKFQLHLDALKTQSYKTIRFSDLLTGNYNRADKNAVLSFDDGLLDNYEQALPLITDYGYVGTFFVVPGFDRITRWVHPRKRKWSNTKIDGYTIPYKNMNKAHRRELLNAGMEIGSHSFTHSKLSQIDPKFLSYEIISSKQFLEDELGTSIKTFCYPNGRYNTTVCNMVKEAGYLGATTTIPGYYNPNKSPFKTNRFLVENPYFFNEVLKGKGLSAFAYISSKLQGFF